MKNVILHYPLNKTYKEYKFKVPGTDLSSVLRKRISAELSIFKDIEYLLILKKYDNCLSFLQEDKPFNKLIDENRIHIQLVVPPKEAEFLLPNQSVIHFPIDLTKSVSENAKHLISHLQQTGSSNSIMKNNEDLIFESVTFFFTPNHSDSDGFDNTQIDDNNNNLNRPKIVSSTLPLLFQGWMGERLTLIRRLSSIDLFIADERWKRREKQIQKMKQNFEESKNEAINNSNRKKTVKFGAINDQENEQQNLFLIEKSKSISNFEFKEQNIESLPKEEEDDNENKLSQFKNNQGKFTSDENYFDFTTEQFFSNCQLAVLNKLCAFDLNTWCALACLQIAASHANLKHTQIQNLLPFIPDSVQNAVKDNDQSTIILTNTLTEMKKKYSKYEKMQAMRTYVQLCVENGESFCYSEDIKFLLLTKKWRVSSHRIIYISTEKISIAKDENSTDFLYQSYISDIVNISFDGDFIIITFDIYTQNNEQNAQQTPESGMIRMEKWRIKSHHPQIIVYMINELRSIIYQSSKTLSNLPISSPFISKNRSTDFQKLVSAKQINKAKSSGMLINFVLNLNSLKNPENDNETSNTIYNESIENDDNNNSNNIIQGDFSSSNINDFYFGNFESSIEFDSDFVEPGISKLICTSKEDANKPCSEVLINEQTKELKLIRKLCLPYKIDNLKSSSEQSLNSYSGLDNMLEVPDINWLLDVNKSLSITQKNGQIIMILGIFIIFLFVFTIFK